MRIMFALLALVLVSTKDTQPTITAQGPSIQVLGQSVESHFPNDLTFHLQVRSDAGDIVKAELLINVGWEETMTWVVPEPFTPSAEVNLTAVWRTFLQTIPPFTEITYHWKVVDRTGQEFSTEPFRTEYADTTHDWKRLEDEHVVVLWYAWEDSVGQALFKASQEAYDHVAHITGTTTERAIRVVIYGSQDDFCVFFPPRTCGDWIGGLTSTGITVQWGFIQALDWFTNDVIPHELAHVFYSEIFRDTWMNIPTWFNEGIAVYNERRDHAWDLALVQEAAEEGKLKTLRVMTRGGGVSEGEVHLWYAMAYSLVAYLAETYGEEKLGELILTVADNTPFEGALIQTTSLDMTELEIEWRAWLGYPVDSLPTPRPFPTMPLVTLVPPSIRREQATDTLIPTVSSIHTLLPTDTPTTAPTHKSRPMNTRTVIEIASPIVVLLLLVWLIVRRVRRRKAS
jgi:hypothetical protein